MSEYLTPSKFEGNERFKVLSILGRGGMGVVYAVYDQERKKKMALKTLNEGNPDELIRLKNEFRVLQDIEHPNFVTLGELFEDRGLWFFTMELVEGQDFVNHVRSITRADGRRTFDAQRLRSSFFQLTKALLVLHSKNRLHRDIKPENVLVQDDGRVVLLDFGLVTQVDPGQKSIMHFMPVGTAAYMSPEQAASKELGPESDWYSSGILLYHALTGTPPFTGSYNEILIAKHVSEPPDPMELEPEVPEDLRQLCIKLMKVNPQERASGLEIMEIIQPDSSQEIQKNLPTFFNVPVFVGRVNERRWLHSLSESVAKEGIQVALVHGVSGLGKSELLRCIANEVLDSNPRAVVLWGRCNEREMVSYKAFDGMIDALSRQLSRLSEKEVMQLIPRNVDLLAKVFPVLSSLSDMVNYSRDRARSVQDPQDIRQMAFAALRELLVRLADRHPLVVVLDDLQWVDEDSLKLLRALTQRPEAPSMFLVLSMRTSSDPKEAAGAVSNFCSQLPTEVHRLHLEPLSTEDARDLILELLPTDSQHGSSLSDFAEMITREADGHPLFLHELVQYSKTHRIQKESHFFLDDVLWERICSLERSFQELVELVSISFGPLTQEVAGQIMGESPHEVFRMAARLRNLHLVRTEGSVPENLVEPYHDRVRESVQARLDDARKLEWHRKIVDVLSAREDSEPERLASHLEMIGEKDQAAVLLEKAGDRASESLAFNRAAGLYANALRLGSEGVQSQNPDELRNLRERMGAALANAGRGREAAHALLAAVPGATFERALELKRKASEQFMVAGYHDEGFDVTAQVLSSIGMRLPRTAFGALLSLAWRRLLLVLRGTRYHERPEDQVTPINLRQVDILHSVARGLGCTDHIRGADFNTRFLLKALKIGEPRRILSALSLEASYTASLQPDSSYTIRTLSACETLQKQLNDPRATIYIEGAQAFAEHMRGNWAAAGRHAEISSKVSLEYGGTSWERGMMNFTILWSLYYRGELAEMSRRMPAQLQEARDRGDLFSVSGLVLGINNIMLLNQHGPERAMSEIEDLLGRWSVLGYHLQHFWALLSKAHIHLYCSRGENALGLVQGDWPRLIRSLLTKLPAVSNECIQLRGKTLLSSALMSHGSRKKDLLSKSRRDMQKLQRARLPWVRAWGGLLSAAYLIQTGDPKGAIEELSQAILVFESFEMKLYHAACRIRYGEILGGDRGRKEKEEGLAFLTAQGVTDPSSMLDLLAPGFPGT